jgi:Ca2+-binding EF-hand superfamily protein
VLSEQMMGGGAGADVRVLLDSDADGVLSADEIAAASDRLKTRDADDNDLLYASEISGAPAGGPYGRPVVRQAQYLQPAALLGPTATADGLFTALSEQYKNADGDMIAARFHAVPALFTTLDTNSNGMLGKDEVLALNDVPPHIELTVDLGPEGQGMALNSVVAELTKTAEAKESATLELPGVRLALTARLNPPAAANAGPMGDVYIKQLDKDSNGYLEKSELQQGLAQQFDVWDGNEDGKVYAEEITESTQRQMVPASTQIVANVVNQGNSLFQSLDQTGDGRISAREMRVARQQILQLDKDEDGQITQREIPATFAVSFGFGNTGNPYRVVAAGGMPGAATPRAPANGPEWFVRMDRNGDGDVTLKEFLGDEAEFKQLDANADGFIEAKEAEAIETGK